MSTSTTEHELIPGRINTRVLDEGYGPGAWHGADLKAALADVSPDLAFWRPAPGRHNIAEIALHHAYCVRSVRAQISGTRPEPFVLDGEDWFALPDQRVLAWPEIQTTLEAQQTGLSTLVADIDAGRAHGSLTGRERFDLVLGITCHAAYHAGQVQLIKVFNAQNVS
jgi:DinB superfamily